jgi:hypothetical protein
MTKKLLILSLCLLLFSCKKNGIAPPKEKEITTLPPDTATTPSGFILGNWLEGPQLHNGRVVKLGYTTSYEFFTDGACKFKPGYWDMKSYFDTLPKKYKTPQYLGQTTNYGLYRDSLHIYNPADKKWERYKIKTLTRDSLVIGRDTTYNIYLKKHYLTDTIPDFDAVIVAAAPCFGKCPINFIMIENTGKVTYTSVEYTENKGFYTSGISKADFNAIMNDFKKADYMNLDSNYSAGATDMSTTYITFIKNGKIVKSISDYGQAGPNEFVSAYTPLKYLEQKLKLTQIKIPEQLKTEPYVNFGLKGHSFTSAESFYLYYRIINGKITNRNFDKKYTFSYGLSEKTYIKSDGRYFQLKSGNRYITIDTGSNFLEGNKFHIDRLSKDKKNE